VATGRENEAVMPETLRLHPLINLKAGQKVCRDRLENTGADSAEDVLPALTFDDPDVDSSPSQQVTEQQSGRPGADDRNVGSGLHRLHQNG
jgi:hypothetical protein